MFKYRMNRPTYWLCYVIFMVAVSFLAYIGKLNGGMEMAMIVIGIRRLHDIGRTGWIVGGVILAEVVIMFWGASRRCEHGHPRDYRGRPLPNDCLARDLAGNYDRRTWAK